MSEASRRRGLISLRQGLLLIFVLGTVGLGAELLLLGHFQEWRQQVPLGLLALGLVVVAAQVRYYGAAVLRLFRLTMLAFVLGGIAGLWFHLESNMDYELALNSRLTGWDLLFTAARGALPALAPGALIQLGLIGLVYTLCHPDPGGEETTER